MYTEAGLTTARALIFGIVWYNFGVFVLWTAPRDLLYYPSGSLATGFGIVHYPFLPTTYRYCMMTQHDAACAKLVVLGSVAEADESSSFTVSPVRPVIRCSEQTYVDEYEGDVTQARI